MLKFYSVNHNSVNGNGNYLLVEPEENNFHIVKGEGGFLSPCSSKPKVLYWQPMICDSFNDSPLKMQYFVFKINK